MNILNTTKKVGKKVIFSLLEPHLANTVDKELSKSIWLDKLSTEDVKAITIPDSFGSIGKNNENSLFLTSQNLIPEFIPKDRIVAAQAVLSNKSYLYILNDAILSGKIPLIYNKYGHLIRDSVFFSDEHQRLRSQLLVNKKFKYFKPKIITNKAKVDCAVLMFSNWNHFGHWVPEHLLKLRKVELLKANSNKNIKLIVEDDFPNWKLELLERLGWSENDLVYWKNNEVHVKELIVPSYPQPSYSDFKWLKKSLFPNGFKAKGPERIYLSRDKFESRKVSNEEELIKFLDNYGFKTIYPEMLSIEEQASIMHSAKIVIGPHGSAFTNIIFGEALDIIEFYGTHVPLGFYCLAQVLGFRHHQLYCTDDGNKSSNMYVDTTKLKNLLNQIIQEK